MPSIPRRSTTTDSSDNLQTAQEPQQRSRRDARHFSSDYSSTYIDTLDDRTFSSTNEPLDKNIFSFDINSLDIRDVPDDEPSTSLDLPQAPDSPLHKRQQQTVAIPLTYKGLDATGKSTDPPPGTVVGIVLGSVAGALLLFWLVLFTIRNARNATGVIEQDAETDVEIVERHHHSHSSPHRRRKRRSRHHSSHHSEMSERTAPPEPAPAPERRERILVSETRRTERSRARQPSIPPPTQTVSESRHESFEETRERRVDGDDEVVVIEEHSELSSEQPKRRSKRSSGFRTVDPNAYAGGDFPQRSVYDDGGRRRSSGRK